ncbi:MAG: M20/M25/M40 family metallo-hydrolase [Chakrabartia sp.]
MPRYFLRAALCASAAMLAPAAHAALSPAETKMVAHVERDHERNVALLAQLVNQNSGSMNLAGVEAVAQMMRAELEPLGFRVTWIPLRETGRAGHLVASKTGRAQGKRLLLIAHLDTVFEKDSPFQKFVRRTGPGLDEAEGPGAADDKGGMVTIIAALRAMKAAGTLSGANIDIHMTGDEEDTGEPVSTARRDLIAAGKRADVALDFEGLVRDGGRDMGSISRRSSNSWWLEAQAPSGHSSGIFSPGVGDGAIFELTRILARFRSELPEPNLTFNVGLMAGGQEAALDGDGVRASAKGKTNIIPATALARGDFRTLSAEQTARVRARMEAIVADHAPHTTARIRFDEGYPPMAPTPGNKAVLDRLNGVNADLGLPPMPVLDPLKRGAGDISFVAADVDGLAGLGPASRGDHAPGETVDLLSLKVQAKRAAILMSRLAAEKGRVRR